MGVRAALWELEMGVRGVGVVIARRCSLYLAVFMGCIEGVVDCCSR